MMAQRREAPAASVLEIVWRQRGIVMAVLGLCAVVGLAYLLVATPLYTCFARLYVTRTSPRLLPNVPDRAPEGGEDNFLFTQREIITSTPVLAMTLGTPGIRDLRTFEGQ